MEIALIVTHDGVFHTDDVAAVSVLAQLSPEAAIRRTRDPAFIAAALANPSAIVVDVGGGQYDHHQPGGNGVRENGVPYAAFGLVWRDFGEAYVRRVIGDLGTFQINDSTVAKIVDAISADLACPIDAHDTGVELFTTRIPDIRPITLQDIMQSWNPVNADAQSYDSAFLDALNFTKGFLSRHVISCAQRIVLEDVIRHGIAQWSGDPTDPIVLDRFVPGWQKQICETNAMFVVFPRLQGGWNAIAVPENPESKNNRALAPSAWRGRNGDALSTIAGVQDAIFCHQNGFIFAAESLESAISMAKQAAQATHTQVHHESRPSRSR